MAGADEEDEDFAPTQPVMSVLLNGVVAYVEVRSGHDNRSRGVKTHLKKLGASIAESLTKDVTHVVFNEGLPSTYKKAKKFKCHLVSVLWIEACKEQLTLVSEAAYPPIGKEIYEDPKSIKNFKKMKSMQPDYDEEESERRTNAVLKRIQRRRPKSTPVVDFEAQNKPSSSSSPKSTPPNNQKRTQALSRKAPGKNTKRSKQSKVSGKVALKEIAPNNLNNPVNLEDVQVNAKSTGNNNSHNVEPIENMRAEPSQGSMSSSPSVIFCGVVEEAGPSTKNLKRPSAVLKNSHVSRADFVEGLNDIVHSLSNESKRRTYEMSPWRKRSHLPTIPEPSSVLLPGQHSAKRNLKNESKGVLSEVSPRRSLRGATTSSSPHSFVRRSPRYERGKKVSKKDNKEEKTFVKPPYASASAALHHKRKVQTCIPKDEDSMLLSQDVNDMPSIDDMAKMKMGAIKAGDEIITLSQILRSYNEAALVKDQISDHSSASSSSVSLEQEVPQFEELTFSEEVEVEAPNADGEKCLVNTCASDSGSTKSSSSTRVLIDGKDPRDLPPLVESVNWEEPSANNIDDKNSPVPGIAREEPERGSSPVFVIKKAKIRRPTKKQAAVNKCLSPSHCAKVSEGFSQMTAKANEGTSVSVFQSSSLTKEDVMSPVDYINKLLLPKFTKNLNYTPKNFEFGEVLVEETPDISSSFTKPIHDSVVVPATPENPAGSLEDVHVNQLMVKPNTPQPKTGLKVPLFSSQSKNTLVGIVKRPPFSTPAQNSSTSVLFKVNDSSKRTRTIPGREPATSRLSPVGDPQVRRSPRIQSDLSHLPKKVQNDVLSDLDPDSKAISKTRKSQHAEDKKDKKVHCHSKQEIVRGKKQENDNLGNFGAESEILKSQDYDSSNGNSDKTKKSSSSGSSSRSSTRAMKRNGLAPEAIKPIKKRSKFLETDDISGHEVIDKQGNKHLAPEILEGKNCQSLSNLENKKLKLRFQVDSCSVQRESRSKKPGLRSKSLSSCDFSENSENQLERKSSIEAKKRMAKSLTRNIPSDPPKVIVCTFLTTSEQNGIEAAGERLKGWKLEGKVTSRTTHVINSGPKRTLNMLKGMARGCWLVDQNWMLDSSKNGTWLSEEKYELVQFSPAVQKCRLKRQAVGKDYKHKLFEKIGPMYVSPKIESPPAKDLRELLELCGADVRTSIQEAHVVVSNEPSTKGVQCVKSLWVLDCVTKNRILPFSAQ